MVFPVTESIGPITSWTKTSLGIAGSAGEVAFKIIFYTPHMVRVCLERPASTGDDFSYAVIAQPDEFKVVTKESDGVIECKSDALTIRVTQKPFLISFLDKKGHVINEDDAGLGTSWIGDQVTTYKKLQEGERFIGLGEKTGPLDKRGRGYQHWNTDAFGYSSGSDPLYSTIPFYIGIHGSKSYGIFLDNTHKSFFNFGASNDRFASFSADAGSMDYYFIGGDIPTVLHNYTHLTGRMPLPPRWSLGYQQCRYSYYPDKEVLAIARTFREKDMPADAIVLDIHYMDKYKIFTWDKERFPDPRALISNLREMGFHVVVMCDPGIKTEKGYAPYDDGLAGDVFIKYPDGMPYTGQVWPGWCHFPDFTRPATRSWWAGHFKGYVEEGVDGFWNDMNEIATWGNMLPENVQLDFEGRHVPMRTARNVYGLQMARATYEGTRALLNGKRPFNLTRSGYSGIQRYAAMWTGDNVSYNEHMLLGVRMVTGLGLGGVAFAGYDVGGFVGEADVRLFARWFSIGALSPFFRGHTMINSRDAEPWTFGEEVEQISRNYLNLRYRLLPYIYSLFYEASQTGMPVQRSLAIYWPYAKQVYTYGDEYLFGPYILVAPVESSQELTKVYLPEGNWYYLYNGVAYAGGSEIMIECPLSRLPVFVKEGAILPMQKVISHTGEKTDTLELHLYASGGRATDSFTFYEDDGESYDHEKGIYSQRLIERGPRKLSISEADGTYASPFTMLKLILHGYETLSGILVNSRKAKVQQEVMHFMAPLEKFDPIADPEPVPEETVQVAETSFGNGKVDISW